MKVMILCFLSHLYGTLVNLILSLLKTVFNFMILQKNGRYGIVEDYLFQFVKCRHNIMVHNQFSSLCDTKFLNGN